MLKDLKEKVKNISEIVGMISITGTLIAIITATVYDFGFFAYFSTYLWNIPISISEILRDTVVIFPKIVLTLITTFFFSCILLPIGRMLIPFLIKIKEIKYKINKTFNKNKENIGEKRKKGYKELIRIEILLFLLVFLYVYMIMIDSFVFNPFVFFSLIFLIFLTGYYRKKLSKYSICRWIIGVSFFYLINLFFLGIYDANQEAYIQKYNRDYVVMKNGEILDNLKILRVYDNGMFIIKANDNLPILSPNKKSFVGKPEEMNLSFIYSTEIDKYYMQNKSINIIRRNFLIDYDAFTNTIRNNKYWWFIFIVGPIIFILFSVLVF